MKSPVRTEKNTGASPRNSGQASTLWMECAILLLAYVVAFLIRLFSVASHESLLHEFEPYFNFRATKFYMENGWDAFQNWFDDRAWYPLGRVIGGTVYPGLMVLSSFLYRIVSALNGQIELRTVCMYLSPFMAANTVVMTYFLCKEALADRSKDPVGNVKARSAGVTAAAFMAIVPAFINHTTAGSYDNEALAVFALISTYYFWLKAVHTGSTFWSLMCVFSYFCLASVHGGYLVVHNTLPLYVIAMLASGAYSKRLYVAYSVFYAFGTLLAMNVQFIGFQPVLTLEHACGLVGFLLLQLYAAVDLGHSYMPVDMRGAYWSHIKRGSVFLCALVAALAVLNSGLGVVNWTDRFYAVLDPTFAKKNIPIMASVSEHQPTTWASFFFDFHILTMLIPSGLYHCFKASSDGKIFLIVVAVTSLYLAAVMVRLLLLLAPIASILGALSITETFHRNFVIVKYGDGRKATGKGARTVSTKMMSPTKMKRKQNDESGNQNMYVRETAIVVSLITTVFLVFFTWHCTWVASAAYSAPSLVLSATQNDGSKVVFDDFREAYGWLRENTDEDAKVMSWWDYGYHLTSMANRTTIVDNNAWNDTHIATTALAMVLPEKEAYPILQSLDVDYVMVTFGGLTGYGSDDMNKFSWMVRIANGTFPERVNEKEYYVGRRRFHGGKQGAPALLNSLAYSLCYYDFGKITTDVGKSTGYDRVRGYEIGRKNIKLEHLEEVMTTEHWLVRIFRVKKPLNLK